MDIGPWGVGTLAAQAMGAVALAVAVVSPPSGPTDPVVVTQLRAQAGNDRLYARLTDVCSRLDGGNPPVRIVPAGTAMDVLKVDKARCDGFTVPMLFVRLPDGAHGLVVHPETLADLH